MPEKIASEEKIHIPIFINTQKYIINAAEIYLRFDPSELQVVSVSKENSFFQLWITGEPKFSNETGEISFAGGLPTPGFSGKGQVGAVEIVAKKPGRHQLSFDGRTRILLNDGLGTAIPLNLRPIKFKVK